MCYEIREGTVDAGRPELARLRKAAQEGLIDVLVIASLEQLTQECSGEYYAHRTTQGFRSGD
jgi:DNA invertase Pin-like site-specific DNA recombinase